MPNLSFTTAFPVAFTKIKSADMTSWLTDIQTLLNTTKLDSTNVQANALTLDRLAAATAADGFVVANASKNLTHTADPALPFVNLSQDPAAPATSHIKLYAKSSKLYTMNEAGAVSQVGTGAGASATQYITNPSAANDTSGWAAYNNTFTATISIASPAVVTATAHGMNSGDLVAFTTTGALPTGITAGTNYRVSKIDANTFNLLDASSGAQINTSGTQSGTQTAHPVQPITGTGGTPAATLARTTTSPLNGVSSFLYTPGTSGEGVSTALTINRVDLTSPLQVEVDVEVASGTYSDGDVTVWVVDTSTGAKVQPAPYQILNAGKPQRFIATFQGTGNSALQFCIHQATGNNAYTLRFQASVTNQVVPTGVPATDWTSYTPTLGQPTGITNNVAEWRRVGDSIHVRGTYYQNSAGSSAAQTVGLPNSWAFDTTKMPSTSASHYGTFLWVDSSSNNNIGFFGLNGSTLQMSVQGGFGPLYPSNCKTGTYVQYEFSVPVTGWSSNVQVSSSADTRVCAFTANSLSGSQTASGSYQLVTGWGTTSDTHSGFDGSGTYTIKVPGKYLISGIVNFAYTATGNQQTQVIKNGSTLTNGAYSYAVSANASQTSSTFSALVDCVAGDTIQIKAYQASGGSLAFNSGNWFIQRLSGPSQIAATETVLTRVATISGDPAASSVVAFTSIQKSSHNNYSGGVFTCVVSGQYEVTAIMHNSATSTAFVTLQQNGSDVARMFNAQDWAGTHHGSATVSCLAGDTLRLYNNNATWTTGGTNAVPALFQATFKRVGNY